jgi:hypothetical protein
MPGYRLNFPVNRPQPRGLQRIQCSCEVTHPAQEMTVCAEDQSSGATIQNTRQDSQYQHSGKAGRAQIYARMPYGLLWNSASKFFGIKKKTMARQVQPPSRLLDRDQASRKEARKEFEGSLAIYESFPTKNPEQFSADVTGV